MQRILIAGNSGSGKSTMARQLSAEHSIAHLDLDTLAWSAMAVRRPIEESASLLSDFMGQHQEWVIEGCYAGLLERALPFATELRFLNPGAEACMDNCRKRPWEPHKYASKDEQDERLEFLLRWVGEYEIRQDEYSLTAHRRLFDRFAGEKHEITQLAENHPLESASGAVLP